MLEEGSDQVRGVLLAHPRLYVRHVYTGVSVDLEQGLMVEVHLQITRHTNLYVGPGLLRRLGGAGLRHLKGLSRKDLVRILYTVKALQLFHDGTKALRDGAKIVPSMHGYLHIGSFLYRYSYCPFTEQRAIMPLIQVCSCLRWAVCLSYSSPLTPKSTQSGSCFTLVFHAQVGVWSRDWILAIRRPAYLVAYFAA